MDRYELVKKAIRALQEKLMDEFKQEQLDKSLDARIALIHKYSELYNDIENWSEDIV